MMLHAIFSLVPFFAQYNLFGANVYMCYDYVHFDNLSDIIAYRNHNVQLCKMQNPYVTTDNVIIAR